MKSVFLLPLMILFSLSPLFSQFEGEVILNASGHSNAAISFLVKGNKVKMIPESDEPVTMYLNGETQKFTVVSQKDGKQTAVEFSLGSDSPMGAMLNSEQVKTQLNERSMYANCAFDQDVRTETYQGHRCKVMKGSCPDGNEVEIWVAEDLNLSIAQLFPVNGPGTDRLLQQSQVAGINGFPLKIRTTDNKGNVSTVENQVSPRTVSETEVSLPEGINPLDMNTLMEQLLEAQSDPEKMQELQEQLEMIRKMSEY